MDVLCILSLALNAYLFIGITLWRGKNAKIDAALRAQLTDTRASEVITAQTVRYGHSALADASRHYQHYTTP